MSVVTNAKEHLKKILSLGAYRKKKLSDSAEQSTLSQVKLGCLQPSETLAPGARVEIRDAEWMIRRVDSTSTGGKSLLVTGISEIIRGREARFLTEIEGKSLKILDPAETTLVPDDSPQFRQTRLYLESLLRQSPPTDTDLWIGTGPPSTTSPSSLIRHSRRSTSPALAFLSPTPSVLARRSSAASSSPN